MIVRSRSSDSTAIGASNQKPESYYPGGIIGKWSRELNEWLGLGSLIYSIENWNENWMVYEGQRVNNKLHNYFLFFPFILKSLNQM